MKTNLSKGAVALLSFAALAVLPYCNSGKTNAEADPRIKATQTGLASYYGTKLEGEATASGEILDKEEMVAAHPSYPLGTVARITSFENGDTVQVRIIDRGPSDKYQSEGVVIDLSKGAAQRIGMVREGRMKVKVDVLQWGNNERK